MIEFSWGLNARWWWQHRGNGSDDGEFYCYWHQLSFIEHLLYTRYYKELLTHNTWQLLHEVGIVIPILSETNAENN